MPDKTLIKQDEIETNELTVDIIQAETISGNVVCNENVTIKTLKGRE